MSWWAMTSHHRWLHQNKNWQQSRTARIWSPHYTEPCAWLHKSYLACMVMIQMGHNCFTPRISMTKLGLWLSHTDLAAVMIVWLVTNIQVANTYDSLVYDRVTPGLHVYHTLVREWVTPRLPQLQQGWVVTEWHAGCHCYETVWY